MIPFRLTESIAAASVSTGGSAVAAKSAEAVAFVNTGGHAISARSAEVQTSVTMGSTAVGARSAEGVPLINTGSFRVGARPQRIQSDPREALLAARPRDDDTVTLKPPCTRARERTHGVKAHVPLSMW